MKRAVGYRRVSDISQAKNHSLEHQSELIRAAADARGWSVEIREEGNSGAGSGKNLTDRATLSLLLDELDLQRYDALIVTKLDRLSRNTLDGLSILKRAKAKGWDVVVLDPSLDTSSPAGEAMVTMLWAFATYERRVILERTQAGRAAAKLAGKHLGRYSELPLDVLTEITEARARKMTLRQIAAALNEKGTLSATGRPWNTGTVSRAARSVSARTHPVRKHKPTPTEADAT